MSNRLSVELALNAKGYNSEIDKSKEATSEFNKTVEETNKATEQYTNTIGKQTKDLASLRKALGQSKKEAQDLAYAYSQLSKEEKESAIGRQMKKQLDEAIQSAADFSDILGDVSTQIKNVANDVGTWDALKDGIEMTGSALSTVGGIYASITGDQDAFNRAIAMYTTTQSAATTITKVANALQKESNLMLKVAAVQEWAKQKAIIASTSATKGATIAQRAFNLVAKANPYVLLATAIAAVVGALVAFTMKSGDAKKEQERLNREIEKSQKELKELNANEDYKIRVAEAAGAGADELRRMRFEAAKAANELAWLNQQKVLSNPNATQEQKQAAMAQEQETWDHWIKVQQDNNIERIKEETAAKKKGNDTRKEELSILQQLQKDESKYKRLLEDAVATNNELDKEKYLGQLKEVQGRIKEINDEMDKLLKEEEKSLTPLESLQSKQKELNALLDDAIFKNNQINIVKYSNQLATVNKQIDDMNKKLETTRDLTLSRGEGKTNFASQAPNKAKTDVKLKVPAGVSMPKPKYTLDDYLGNVDNVFSAVGAVDSLKGSITSLVESINEGADAWDIFAGAIGIVQNAMQTFVSVMQAVAAVQEIVNMLSEQHATQQREQAAETVANAGAEIAAESGKAIASGTASAAKAGFPAILFAIPAVLALIMGALAMAGSFDSGGIVGGSSFHGDNLVARVNSGEMILNQRQQRNMFDAIDSGSLGGGHVDVGGNITIKGSDLHVALRNYDKKMSKI